MSSRDRILSRDIEAVLVPYGNKFTVPAGARVALMQTLGGSFTVMGDFGMARVGDEYADALGEKVAAVPKLQPSGSDTQSAADSDRAPDPDLLWSQLRTVYDPEIPVNIVDLGLVYSMDVKPRAEGGHRVEVQMTLTAPGCGMGPAIADDARAKIMHVPGVDEAEVKLTWDPPWNQNMISDEGKMKLGLI